MTEKKGKGVKIRSEQKKMYSDNKLNYMRMSTGKKQIIHILLSLSFFLFLSLSLYLSLLFYLSLPLPVCLSLTLCLHLTLCLSVSLFLLQINSHTFILHLSFHSQLLTFRTELEVIKNNCNFSTCDSQYDIDK